MSIRIIPLFVICLLAISTKMRAQTNVTLVIDHKLATADFQLDQVAQNGLGQNFKLSRMEYLVTRFSIIHDGGQILPVGDEVIALVRAQNYTAIPLGMLNVTTIEGVKFHIGVFEPLNTADPALQAPGTPLGFQNPSMHWGWAAGYRFIALEGKAGTSVNQTVELHGLGNQNYFETTVMAAGEESNGEQFISIVADYTRALDGMSLNSGLVVHGTGLEAASMITNFRDYVFSAGQNVAALKSLAVFDDVKVFPTPSQGKVTLETPANFIGANATLVNAQGQVIQKMTVNEGTKEINIEESGVFMLILETKNKVKKTFKIINK